MLRKTVEVDGKSYTLGEGTAGAVEDVQDALSAPGASEREKMVAMRRFLAHSLNRGGYSVSVEDLATQFTVTELLFMFRHATQVSGLREMPEGEALRP